MVTKGYVSSIINKYKITVRCPIYDKLKTTSISAESNEFSISVPSGISIGIKEGDTVFVGFENNDMNNGVVLGYLSQNDEQESYISIKALSVNVNNLVKLPKQTTIGEITWFDLSNLQGLKSNISEQIEELSLTNNQIYKYINSINEKITDYKKRKEAVISKLKSQKKKLDTIANIVGNKSDITEETLFGRLNSYNKVIDDVNKGMGQFPNDIVISEEISRLNDICDELYNNITITTPTPTPGIVIPYDVMLSRAEKMVNVPWEAKTSFYKWNDDEMFEKGKTYYGMPYTLWWGGYTYKSWYENSDRNYSFTANASNYGERTGPYYGSCCADFVSEVLALPTHSRNCDGIKNQIDYLNALDGESAKAYNLKVGDVLWSEPHVMWVGVVNGDTVTIYEQTPPIARRFNFSVSKDSSNGYVKHSGIVFDVVLRPTERLLELPDNNVSDNTPSIKNNWIYKGSKVYGNYSDQALTEEEYLNNALVFWKMCKKAGWTAESAAGAFANTYAESTGNPWSYGTGGGGIFGFTPFDSGTNWSTGIYDYASDVLGDAEKRWDGDCQVNYVQWQLKNGYHFFTKRPTPDYWNYDPPSDTNIPTNNFDLDVYVKLDKEHYGATPTICAKLWLARYEAVYVNYPGRDLDRTIFNHTKKAEELYQYFIKYGG